MKRQTTQILNWIEKLESNSVERLDEIEIDWKFIYQFIIEP